MHQNLRSREKESQDPGYPDPIQPLLFHHIDTFGIVLCHCKWLFLLKSNLAFKLFFYLTKLLFYPAQGTLQFLRIIRPQGNTSFAPPWTDAKGTFTKM